MIVSVVVSVVVVVMKSQSDGVVAVDMKCSSCTLSHGPANWVGMGVVELEEEEEEVDRVRVIVIDIRRDGCARSDV